MRQSDGREVILLDFAREGRQQAIHHRNASSSSADRRSGAYTRREQKRQGSRFLSRSIRLGGRADAHRSVLKWLLTSHFYHSTWAHMVRSNRGIKTFISDNVGTLRVCEKHEMLLVRHWRSEKWIISGSECSVERVKTNFMEIYRVT